jgi:hypothetical protein
MPRRDLRRRDASAPEQQPEGSHQRGIATVLASQTRHVAPHGSETLGWAMRYPVHNDSLAVKGATP